jgi:hypothetical protein
VTQHCHRRLGNGTKIDIHAPPEIGTSVRLPSGELVRGVPHGTEEQLATAKSIGYDDDVHQMVRDHDPLHALLCDWLGLPTSYGLEVAAGIREADEVVWLEEAAVLAVTLFMRKAGGKLPL